jgi:hypothetical protein
MKVNFCVFVFSCLTTLSLQAIEGTYNVSGVDPVQKAYTGTVTIKKGDNDVYQAEWTLSLQPSKYVGTGLKNNDEVNFVYGATDPKVKSVAGLQMFSIKKDKLEGEFVDWGGSLVGRETLTKQ